MITLWLNIFSDKNDITDELEDVAVDINKLNVEHDSTTNINTYNLPNKYQHIHEPPSYFLYYILHIMALLHAT